jgi:LAO/AO transport system kinase
VSATAILDGLRHRKTAALARAISVVENGTAGFEELLAALHGQLGGARRIGITGPPGGGKSTLIERLAAHYRRANLTVGVIAVDPSSPFTGGALLGDRIRMEGTSTDPGVFIRSMASRGSLGGMATATGEVADVMDAFGFQRILIETVGVGQSELDVASAADTTVVVLVPESGDGIQVMKSGLMEIAEVFVVNKADRPGADRLRQELEVALGLRRGETFRHVPAHHGIELVAGPGTATGKTAAHLGPGEGSGKGAHGGSDGGAGRAAPPPPRGPDGERGWEPPVIMAVAPRSEGVGELAAALDRHFAHLERFGGLAERRSRRLAQRTRDVVDRALRRWVWSEAGPKEALEAAFGDVSAGRRSPYEAAEAIVARIRGGGRT